MCCSLSLAFGRVVSWIFFGKMDSLVLSNDIFRLLISCAGIWPAFFYFWCLHWPFSVLSAEGQRQQQPDARGKTDQKQTKKTDFRKQWRKKLLIASEASLPQPESLKSNIAATTNRRGSPNNWEVFGPNWAFLLHHIWGQNDPQEGLVHDFTIQGLYFNFFLGFGPFFTGSLKESKKIAKKCNPKKCRVSDPLVSHHHFGCEGMGSF